MIILDDTTHSKVDRSNTIEDDKDVVISQLRKTEVHTNCMERGMRI